jgi:hypothetical protein
MLAVCQSKQRLLKDVMAGPPMLVRNEPDAARIAFLIRVVKPER